MIGSEPTPETLIAHYPFDGDALDAGPNGLHLDVATNDPGFTAGKLGQAADFDHTLKQSWHRTDVAELSNIQTSLWFSGWVRWTGYGDLLVIYLKTPEALGSISLFEVTAYFGYIRALWRSDPTTVTVLEYPYLPGDGQIVQGDWYLVNSWFDIATGLVYLKVNGLPTQSLAYPLPLLRQVDDMRIIVGNASPDGAVVAMQGQVDNIILRSVAPTAADLAASWNAGDGAALVL